MRAPLPLLSRNVPCISITTFTLASWCGAEGALNGEELPVGSSSSSLFRGTAGALDCGRCRAVGTAWDCAGSFCTYAFGK